MIQPDRRSSYVSVQTDRLKAKALATLSGIAPDSKPHKWFMAADAPSYVPVRWQVANNPAQSVRDWVEFDGDPNSGRLPRNYASAGILCVDYEALDRLQDREGGKQAVAYSNSIGSVMVAAELPNGFGRKGLDEYRVGMRIGRRPLYATAGIWLDDIKRLIVPEGGLSTQPDTLRVADFPANIPLV
jgi:hypothetical protein